MRNSNLIKICIISVFFCNSIFSQNDNNKEDHKNSGFLDFNGYYDSREFSTITINALVNLPQRFQYFSLTNFQGTDKTSDLSTYYTEQNIRWNLKNNSPIDLTMQWVSRANSNNDNLRLGIRWRLNNTKKIKSFFEKLNLSYSVNFHLLQFTSKSQSNLLPQIEHVYRISLFPSIFKNRIYIGGFADQNINYQDNGKLSFNWVSEHQIGYNIFNSLFIVLEYRINDFLPNNNEGLGYGLEYNIKL